MDRIQWDSALDDTDRGRHTYWIRHGYDLHAGLELPARLLSRIVSITI